MFRKLTTVAFVGGLASLVLSITAGLARLAVRSPQEVHSQTSLFAILGIIAIIAIIVFLICGAALWVESLLITITRWHRRGIIMSVLRLVLLALGTLFVGYVFHAAERSRS